MTNNRFAYLAGVNTPSPDRHQTTPAQFAEPKPDNKLPIEAAEYLDKSFCFKLENTPPDHMADLIFWGFNQAVGWGTNPSWRNEHLLEHGYTAQEATTMVCASLKTGDPEATIIYIADDVPPTKLVLTTKNSTPTFTHTVPKPVGMGKAHALFRDGVSNKFVYDQLANENTAYAILYLTTLGVHPIDLFAKDEGADFPFFEEIKQLIELIDKYGLEAVQQLYNEVYRKFWPTPRDSATLTRYSAISALRVLKDWGIDTSELPLVKTRQFSKPVVVLPTAWESFGRHEGAKLKGKGRLGRLKNMWSPIMTTAYIEHTIELQSISKEGALAGEAMVFARDKTTICNSGACIECALMGDCSKTQVRLFN